MSADLTLDDLTAADCRLVDDPRLLADYNALAGRLRAVRQAFPAALGRLAAAPSVRPPRTAAPGEPDPPPRSLADDLHWVRDRLTRTHYQIGFLGPFQVGKSETGNNLLGQEVLPVGGSGTAASAAVARIRPRPTPGPHRLTLTYQTADQYQARLRALCQHVLGSPDLTPADADKALAQRLQDYDRGQSGGVSRDNLEFFTKFLRSHREHVAKLRPNPAPPPVEPYRMDDGRRHLQHDPAAPSSPNLLLAEGLVEVAGSRLAPEVELIDLPGFGAQSVFDTILTKQYLDELDGALVFANATNITNEKTIDAFRELFDQFGGRLAQRVWLVLTWFDGLNRNAFHGGSPGGGDGGTTFDTIARFIGQYRIPPERVCLVSNPIHALARDPATGQPARAELLAKLEKRRGDIDPVGDDLTPAPWKRHPALCDAYRQVLRDGGIERLRELAAGEVGRGVREEMRRDLGAVLGKVAAAVAGAVRSEVRRQGLGAEATARLGECRTRLYDLRRELDNKPGYFADGARRLRAGLDDTLAKQCPKEETLEEMTPAELRQQFAGNAAALDKQLDYLVREDLVRAVYQHLAPALAGLPAVPVNGSAGVGAAWDAYQAADAAEDRWAERWRVPRFADHSPFEPAAGAIQGKYYRQLMGERIRVAVIHTMNALRVRLRTRLQELLAEVTALGGPAAGTGEAATAQQVTALTAILGDLEGLAARFPP